MSKEIITIKKETKIRKEWFGNDRNTSNGAITSLKKYQLKFTEQRG